MKDNEVLLLLSDGPEEWYQTVYTCSCCGNKIIGVKKKK